MINSAEKVGKPSPDTLNKLKIALKNAAHVEKTDSPLVTVIPITGTILNESVGFLRRPSIASTKLSNSPQQSSIEENVSRLSIPDDLKVTHHKSVSFENSNNFKRRYIFLFSFF